MHSPVMICSLSATAPPCGSLARRPSNHAAIGFPQPEMPPAEDGFDRSLFHGTDLVSLFIQRRQSLDRGLQWLQLKMRVSLVNSRAGVASELLPHLVRNAGIRHHRNEAVS